MNRIQYGEWAEQPDYSEPPLKISGDADHYNHRNNVDQFQQAGDLFRLMSEDEQQRLFANTARAMSGVSEAVKLRHVYNASQADTAYGEGLARILGLSNN